MIDLSFLRSLEKPVAVLGLGVTGKAVADALTKAAVPFHVWYDHAEQDAQNSIYPLYDFSADLPNYAFIVPSPGIKPSHPMLQKAREQHVKILSDIDLLIQSAPNACVIGVTGTNGKSTTTALIGHILAANHIPVAVGGNIGLAACSLLPLGREGIYVLELSSYQLEISAHPACDIAVFLNVAPDHLDWHGDFENYVAAKEKITLPRADRMKQHAVIGVDTPVTAQLAVRLSSSPAYQMTCISTQSAPQSGYVTARDGILYEGYEKIADIGGHEFLRGRHNHENMAAAYAALRAYSLSPQDIIPSLMAFQGLPHRQKKITQYKDIVFINDSKATNADATQHALASFDSIHWILGGLAKSDGIDGLEVFYPKIRHAYLIGEAAPRFAQKLEGHVPYTLCGTMEKAVTEAFARAREQNTSATILLSPACASFDQYQNFEKRGDHFAALANEIVRGAEAGHE